MEVARIVTEALRNAAAQSRDPFGQYDPFDQCDDEDAPPLHGRRPSPRAEIERQRAAKRKARLERSR